MINYLKNGGKSILQMFDDLGQYCANTYNKVEADNKPKEVLPSLVEHRNASREAFFFANEDATEEAFDVFYTKLLQDKLERELKEANDS